MLKISPLGGLRRGGAWTPGPRVTLVTLIGGADLDLTAATLEPRTVLTKVSLVGGVSVRVPPGVRVEVRRFWLIGGRRGDAGPEGAASVLVVRSFGLIGGVRVER